MRTHLISTRELDGFVKHLKANGCDVDRDRDAGTVRVKDGDTIVLMAIQKGGGQPWIATFSDSDRIQWKGGVEPPDEAPCPSCGNVGVFGSLCDECSKAVEE